MKQVYQGHHDLGHHDLGHLVLKVGHQDLSQAHYDRGGWLTVTYKLPTVTAHYLPKKTGQLPSPPRRHGDFRYPSAKDETCLALHHG